jgi:D-sedoheptulose 7-phosphate isomerase
MTTCGLAGEGGGTMAPLCDILLDVPSRSTPRVQEIHVALYHYLCREVEARLAPKA